MEQNKEFPGLLDLINRPGFCVNNQIITTVNSAAKALLITPGTDVQTLLSTGREEYSTFQSGCLFLNLSIGTQSIPAAVTASKEGHIFLLDHTTDDSALQAMALAAQELRVPLTSLLISSQQLSSQTDGCRQELARLSRGLHQLQRILGNMSDAGRVCAGSQEVYNLTALLEEVFEKASVMVSLSGAKLIYRSLDSPILSLANRDQLERAILNVLANALKFLPENGTITCTLSRTGRLLCLQIRDDGPGISEDLRGILFHRYLRQPGIEDSRFGLGLGLILVHNIMAAHGGTVLIDHPSDGGTRVTLTLKIRENTTGILRSPVCRFDYAGGYDHALLELSEVLPLSVYEKEKI